jgi:hypothetical protein
MDPALAARWNLERHTDDSRRSRRFKPSWWQAGSERPLAWQAASTMASQRRSCCAGQQECTDRVRYALRRYSLRARILGENGLKAANSGTTTAIAAKWQEMAKRSHRRFPNLVCGPARLWPSLGAVEVEAGENPSRLAARKSSRITKPDIRQQLGPSIQIQPTCCNRAGSIYVHTWPVAKNLAASLRSPFFVMSTTAWGPKADAGR